MSHTDHSRRIERQLQRARGDEDGVALLDNQLRYLMVDDSMAALHGLAVEDHIGRTVADVLPALAPTIEPLLRQVIQSGEPVIDVEIEGMFLLEGPARRWLASYYPVRSRTGLVVAIDALMRPLPAQPRSQNSLLSLAALRERERFAASVTEVAPYLIYVYDLTANRNRYVNRRIEQLYGYTQDEFDEMGAGFLFRLLHPDDVAGVVGQIERLRAASDGEILTHEYRFRHKDGSWRWLCSHEMIFQRDADGTVIQVLGIAEDITVRKAAEATVRWQANLIEQSHEAGLVWNLDGGLAFWNRGAEALYGYSRAEVLGHPVHSLLQTREREALPALMAELERSGSWAGELTRQTRDGSLIVVDSRMTLIPSPTGQTQVLETNRDMTALKAAQERLRISEERFRVALQGSPVVVFNQDRELRYTWINNPALGFAADEMIGRCDADLSNQIENTELLVMLKRQVLADGVGRRHEVPLRDQDGEHWFDLTIEPLRDANGQIEGVTCAAINITAQKQREQELRRANERLALALDRLDGFLYEYEVPSGRVERSNGMAQVLGYALDEVPETEAWWVAQIHPDEREQALQRGVALLQSDSTSFTQEYRVRHKDGHYLTVWDRGVIERDAEGRPLRMLGTTINITERKAAEAERAELLERERIAHQETEAALARAEAATRERDLLISVASHDLRTPLTVVLGQALLLQRRATRLNLDAGAQRSATMIAEQAERLNQMIGALLDLSRIQEGRLTIQPETLDLGALLVRVVGTIHSTVTVHELLLHGPEQPITLRADPLRLEQVFLNLLSNAVKYSPNGGRIEVWTEHRPGQVQIHIRDQGIGIPADALPHLFTRFYRASNAAQQATSSLGVGLFVVRELVQAHSGSISVTSELGRGSTFTVTLPLP